MSIRFRWLGYVCFEIILPSGKVMVIDPYIDFSPTAPIKCQEVTGADYIVVTHGHYDHVTDIGPLAQRFNSKVICSYDVAEPLTRLFELDPSIMIRVRAGDNIVFDDLKVEVKKGEHISIIDVMKTMYQRITGKEASPDTSVSEIREALQPMLARSSNPELSVVMGKIADVGLEGGEQLNFVFQTGDNLRFYIYSSGAYEYLRQEVIGAHPNVLFVQLGGLSPEKVADIAALSGAEVVIPTHHDGGGIEETHTTAQEMAKHLAAKSRAHFMDIEHGKWYEIGVGVSTI